MNKFRDHEPARSSMNQVGRSNITNGDFNEKVPSRVSSCKATEELLILANANAHARRTIFPSTLIRLNTTAISMTSTAPLLSHHVKRELTDHCITQGSSSSVFFDSLLSFDASFQADDSQNSIDILVDDSFAIRVAGEQQGRWWWCRPCRTNTDV